MLSYGPGAGKKTGGEMHGMQFPQVESEADHSSAQTIEKSKLKFRVFGQMI